jgi:RNA polymerase sigma-B factor
VRAHLALADAIAGAMARRLAPLVERDDLIQIAREALVRSAARCDTTRAPAPYLRRCIKGALLHHLSDGVRLVRISRRAHEAGGMPLRHLSLDAPHPAGGSWMDQLLTAPANLDGNWRSDNLWRVVEQLPAAQAAAVRLTLLQGQSLRSAARELGITATTVQRHQRRALNLLRQQLAA